MSCGRGSMNKWKAFIAGQVIKTITITESPESPERRPMRSRRYTRQDVIAKLKRIKKRRQKKGYK